MYECNICSSVIYIPEEKAYHRTLENIPDSIDVCPQCIQQKNRLSIFHTIVENPIIGRNKCDFCKLSILARHSIITSILYVCSSCLDPSSSLETVDKVINDEMNYC